jgi:hypothetical protein
MSVSFVDEFSAHSKGDMNLSTVSATQYSLPKSRISAERIFFFSITLLICAAVFYGFTSEYVQFRFSFPSLLVYIHTAFFFAWMLLLLVQTSLVSVGQIAWHRRLGITVFFLLCSIKVGRRDFSPVTPEGIVVSLPVTGFGATNVKWSINGYIFGNMPLRKMRVGDRVRWYVATLGDFENAHTPPGTATQ